MCQSKTLDISKTVEHTFQQSIIYSESVEGTELRYEERPRNGRDKEGKE